MCGEDCKEIWEPCNGTCTDLITEGESLCSDSGDSQHQESQAACSGWCASEASCDSWSYNKETGHCYRHTSHACTTDGSVKVNVNTGGRTGEEWTEGVSSWSACRDLCRQRTECNHWTWHKENAGQWAFKCVTMTGYGSMYSNDKTVSGNRTGVDPEHVWGYRLKLSEDGLACSSTEDTCDFSWQHKCGDVCIDRTKNCECTDQVLNIEQKGDGHCCVPPSTTAQCHLDEEYGHGVCPGGTTLSLGVQCNGQCYNQYSQEANSSSLSFRSMYRCDNGECVSASSMCSGYSWCEDKSDLRACNQELTCVYVSTGFTLSTITSDLVDGHSFCVYSNARNDGQYHTISREDEDNLDIVSTSASLNYTKLGHCNDS